MRLELFGLIDFTRETRSRREAAFCFLVRDQREAPAG
jgi:hypothetical protein